MNTLSRIRKSREAWKQKAVQRASTLRDARKQLRKAREQKQELQAQIVALTEGRDRLIAQMRALAEPGSSMVPLSVQQAGTVRVLCVLLAIDAVMPFRSVPRALQITCPGIWIPHFTSVINWTLRLGLALLQGVTPAPEPWIALIDMSIDVAVKKVLVVLRVPLTALALRGSALTLADCEVIGVEVRESWVGEDVAATLRATFAKAGRPVAVLKDGGTDLARGVDLWRNQDKAGAVQTIDDVGHVVANALKASFAGMQAFQRFLATITKGAAKLRQSEIAFLTPPKIRTKGRFQSITKLAAWANKIAPLIGGRGRAPSGSLTASLRRLLGNLGQHRALIQRFVQTCQVAGRFQEIAKNQGINQKSYSLLKSELAQLPERDKVRLRLQRWLDRQINIQARLAIGQTPLVVSSDVLESLFGKFKVIIARNPKAEFTRNILALPTLCGKRSSIDIDNALHQVTHRDLQRWATRNVGVTQWQWRSAFNRGQLLPATVPKTGNARWG